jgi:hypothetical protein
VVVLAVLLPSTAWCIPHLGVSWVDHNNSRIGAVTHNSNRGNSSTTAIVQPCSYPTTIAGCHQAVTTFFRQQHSILQLQEDGALCSRMSPAQAKQLTMSSGTRGQSIEGHQKGPAAWTGRTNYTTVEEIPTGEEVLVCMFFLNERPTVILFDLGASMTL